MVRVLLPKWAAILAALLIPLGLASCGSTPGDCASGEADCACREDQSCNEGLTCMEGTCVAAGGTGGSPSDGSGGTTTNTGGAATGGGNNSMCTGTPTGSCDDPLCDTFPGCTSTEQSSCGSAEDPCSAFDGDMPGCTDQWGCEPSVSGICESYDDPECEWAQSESQCNTLDCYWTGTDCFGNIYEPPNCAGTRSENTCAANPACYWTAAELDYCEGRATACDTMPGHRCELQAGCEVAPATCTGTVTSCGQLGSADCLTQPGCLWNGQGRTDTPTGSAVSLADFAFTEGHIGRRIVNDADYLSVDFAITNRGPRAGTPNVVHIVLSEDAEYDDEDAVIHEIDADTEMAPFGFLPLGWDGDLPMQDISAEHEDGRYTVFIVIDPEDVTSEAEEANNVWAQADVFIGPTTFDLVLADASHDAEGTLEPDDDLTLTLDVENESTTDVGTVPVRVALSDDDVFDAGDIDLACAPTLTLDLAPESGDSFELDCTLPRARGSYFVLVDLDPADTLADANRSDNVMSAGALEIDAPAPDLVVTALDSDDSVYSWKALATLTGTIENAGVDPAPATNITFYLSVNEQIDSADHLVCTRPVAGIPAEDELAFEEECQLPAGAIGAFNLLAVVDPADDIYEADDENNLSDTASLTVNQPNLNLDAIYLQIPDLSSVAPGDEQTIAFRVDNPGTAEIPGYRVEIYASTDQTVTNDDELFCYSDRAALPGGGSLEVTMSCTTPSLAPGEYYLAAFFDPEDEVPETDETDNVAIADITDPLTIEAP